MRSALRPLIAGNWKMHGRSPQLVEIEAIAASVSASPPGADVLVCVPPTLLERAARLAAGRIAIGGENCDAEIAGAFTGDVSAEMLVDAGASAVIVGHSERRRLYGETDATVLAKADRRTLPLNLHGLKGPELFSGVHMSRDRLAAWRAGAPDSIRPIVIDAQGVPDWADEGEVRATGVPFRTPDAEAQIAAARQGIGMTKLPCFVGDADRLLARVPGIDLKARATLWLLTQGRHGRRRASGSSRSSYPAGSPPTLHFSRGCRCRTTEIQQVAQPKSPRPRPTSAAASFAALAVDIQ